MYTLKFLKNWLTRQIASIIAAVSYTHLLVCVLAVYIVVVLYVTLLRGGIGFGGFE